MRKAISIFILLVAYHVSIAQTNNCTYFELPLPKEIPQDFNPEVIHLNGSFKFNVEIKQCDQIYFTTIDTKENIYFSKKDNGKWSKPKIASFSDPNHGDADPFLTKEGDRIYFISKRPTSATDKKLDWNIWFADNKNEAWTEPKPLPQPMNTEEFDEYFFSISEKGNVFFSSNRKGGEGSFDIYTAKILGDNEFSIPQNVGKPVSTENYEFDPYIAPDESFILFSINEKGNSDLYFSLKDEKGNWTEPQNFGDRINVTDQDFAPSLSVDGKFIFFSNDGKLKWVGSHILKTSN
ncbi:TolB family protein [Flagellimonas meridianipacifica]|uniref:WD40 repeat protein n=1 Tax=Flagellimonas meridianipacifica TaxID=1080225 RepID=A0A2T0MBB2_9FLAO|nr:PD40 domain-containing protein [Allomuricauda pacifica]PRX54790.1 WD40 repeat protein [Allomuricauda pacifica]